MAGPSLNTNSTLMCPHGGQVQIISSNTRVKAGGAYAALATDQFIVSGCPFIVGTVPSPCLTVRWVLADLRTSVNGPATLSSGSVGLCQSAQQVPQGPVVVSLTQSKVQSQ